MARNETPVESLRGYLRQLTPQTRSRLLAEIERLRQNGEEVPGSDLILSELRADSRQNKRSAERLEPAARHFFRLIEPFLTDRPPERAGVAQLSRGSLPPLWDWISRDLMASMARDYAGEMKQLLSAGKQREIEKAVQTFQNKAVKYLEGTLASSNGAEQARARLASHGGSPATFDDLGKVLRVLKARAGLAKLTQSLPTRIDKLIGKRLDTTRAALDEFAATHAEAVPFALAAVARRLRAPWQLVRLATKAVETKDAVAVAATPYAIAVTVVLDALDTQVDALYAALKDEHLPRAKELLVDMYDTEYAVRVRIDLPGSQWGNRLDAIMDGVDDLLDTELQALPSGLSHVLRSRGLKHHLSLMGQLTRLGWKCRDAVTGGMLYARNLVETVRKSA